MLTAKRVILRCWGSDSIRPHTVALPVHLCCPQPSLVTQAHLQRYLEAFHAPTQAPAAVANVTSAAASASAATAAAPTIPPVGPASHRGRLQQLLADYSREAEAAADNLKLELADCRRQLADRDSKHSAALRNAIDSLTQQHKQQSALSTQRADGLQSQLPNRSGSW